MASPLWLRWYGTPVIHDAPAGHVATDVASATRAIFGLLGQTFPDESLDFVYLDALHSYRDCMNDLIAWFPKLKAGGLMAGDDYYNGYVPMVSAANFDNFAHL